MTRKVKTVTSTATDNFTRRAMTARRLFECVYGSDAADVIHTLQQLTIRPGDFEESEEKLIRRMKTAADMLSKQ